MNLKNEADLAGNGLWCLREGEISYNLYDYSISQSGKYCRKLHFAQ